MEYRSPRCNKTQTKDNEEITMSFNLDHNDLPIELGEMNVSDRVYLGTLLRSGLSENKKSLTIQNFQENPVAPSLAFLSHMISKLIDQRLITPLSRRFVEHNSSFNYLKSNAEIIKLEFSVNIKNFESNEVIEYLLLPRIVPNSCESELLDIWKIIAVEECKSYLNYSLNYVDFPYNIGDKAHVIFESILNNFSTAQIFGLISRCLGYAAKEFQAGKLSRISAAPYMMGILQNQVDKAINNGWNLTKYFRPRELPESQLSKFFFNRILDIGELGFNVLINEKNLKR